MESETVVLEQLGWQSSALAGSPIVTAEADLVARAQQDRQEFAHLYQDYLPQVYRYCYRGLGSQEAAEDATSQIFTQALAALPRYQIWFLPRLALHDRPQRRCRRSAAEAAGFIPRSCRNARRSCVPARGSAHRDGNETVDRRAR